MAGAKQVRIIYAGPIIIYILCDRRSGREQPRERAAKRNASNAATKQRNLVVSRDKLELMIAADVRNTLREEYGIDLLGGPSKAIAGGN